MTHDQSLRDHLTRQLDWEDAHIAFGRAVADWPPALRGVRPHGAPHSAWQLTEHLRLCQRDILDFCVDPNYQEMDWPDDYWPTVSEPPDDPAWQASLDAFRADRAAFVALIQDPATDLFAAIPHGQGQTYLREALLLADHNAYHVGQLMLLRRLLEAWD